MKNKIVLSLALGSALLMGGPLLADAKAGDRHHRHRSHYYNHHHGPSSGVVLDFNFAPPPVVYRSAPVVRYEYTDGVVVDVQRALNRRGYSAGVADGVMGGRTREAIRDYQYDRGLRVTGTINESLLRSLGL